MPSDALYLRRSCANSDVIRLVAHPLDVLRYYEEGEGSAVYFFTDTFAPDQIKYILLFLDDAKQLCL